MGDAAFWSGLASGALTTSGSLILNMQPLLVVFVGIGAFSLIVYIVRRIGG